MQLLFDKAKWMTTEDGTFVCLKVDTPEAVKLCNSVKDGKSYVADVKEYKRRRSLDANSYFWVLCGKLANKIGLPKDEVYRSLIRDVGDNYEVLPIRNDAVDKWIANWKAKGVGWVCEILGASKLDGYTNVITYYGSSVYDSKQMSTLINLIVQECRQQGIETMTEAELALLMDGWSA